MLGKERPRFDMKIGKLVKHHIERIFQYCETSDHSELDHLKDKKYSKNTFDINYPFCTEASLISKEESGRYWTNRYIVRGKTFRVSSQWFDTSKPQFINYLINKHIFIENETSLDKMSSAPENEPQKSTRENSRFKGNAIGNAQNLLVRNILSNLGQESFSENDWKETKDYFSNQCAYCGASGDLVIDHVIPINKAFLGEHRLGNLIPSCRSCNSTKSDKNYHDFLSGQPNRIEKIEQYMDSRNYVPLGDNKQVAMILEMAYQEVAQVSKRYIAILNELFPNN